MKSKKLIIIGVIVLVIVILVGSIIGGYNGLVSKQEEVSNSQAVIQTQLQRRADLIPNFVATVKGAAEFEKSTYQAVTEARSAVNSATDTASLSDASNKLDGAISVWVNAVKEAYPELAATGNFVALQDELAGTENRIAVARNDYNGSAKDYNTSIRKFPTSIIAGIFGFDKVEYFEASAESQSVPQVSFE